MAGEIVIPFHLSPHRTTNANASWDHLTQTTNTFQPFGIRLPDALASNVNCWLCRPIPTNINGTPGGKIKIHWVTDTATGNDVKFFIYCSDATFNTTSLDPSSWDDSLTVVDTNNGQYVVNECEVSLSSTAQTAGLDLIVLISRNAVDAADTLAADVLVTDVQYVANT